MIKLKNLLETHKAKQEEGSALIFAILLVMVLTLTVVLVTGTAITSANSARELVTRDLLRQAAEAGLNNAVLQANQTTTNVLETRIGSGAAATGAMTGTTSTKTNADLGLRWRWYTQKVIFPGEQAGYYVYSEGYSTVPGMTEKVTLRAQFLSNRISSATYTTSSNVISYEGANPWETGIAGLNSVTVQSGAKVYVADSNYGPNPSGTNSVGSTVMSNNGVAIQDTASGVRSITFGANRTSAVCTGAGCNGVGQTYRGSDYGLTAVSKQFLAGGKCPPGTTYPVWRSSQNNGVLNLPSGSCVSELIFDRDTTIPASFSKTSPLVIFNTGSTTVWKGARVNTNNVPMAFQIYSNGSTSIGDPANVANASNPTRAQFEYASALGSCHVYSGAAYFGVLNCSNVTLATGSITYIDLGAKEITSLDPAARKVWYATYVEEL